MASSDGWCAFRAVVEVIEGVVEMEEDALEDL
jgi:hypothetical protein